jgi:hypothetical protein
MREAGALALLPGSGRATRIPDYEGGTMSTLRRMQNQIRRENEKRRREIKVAYKAEQSTEAKTTEKKEEK